MEISVSVLKAVAVYADSGDHRQREIVTEPWIIKKHNSTAVSVRVKTCEKEQQRTRIHTVSAIRNLRVGRARRPLLDVGCCDEEYVAQSRTRVGDILDILESDAGGVALCIGRKDDAFKAHIVLRGDRDRRPLHADAVMESGQRVRESVSRPPASVAGICSGPLWCM